MLDAFVLSDGLPVLFRTTTALPSLSVSAAFIETRIFLRTVLRVFHHIFRALN